MEALKRHLRSWLPPRLLELCRQRSGRVVFTGNYSSWEAAAAAASSYDDAIILERVAAATREVVAGHAVFERDSRLFREPEPNYPLIAALALAGGGDGLRVLDFGGALGSVYFQNRSWLRELGALEWTVVEQPHFVACGQREFTTAELHFAFSIGEALTAGRPDAVLLSSVLQYLPEPWPVLKELAASGCRYLLIDRTPLRLREAGDRIAVQRIPAALYGGSYPVRFLGEAHLHDALAGEFRLVDGFDSYDMELKLPGETASIRYRGEVWRRRDADL